MSEQALRVEVIHRFNKYWMPEPNSGCWIWLGGKCGSYGRFNWKPANNYAHRASFILFKGKIPQEHEICHACDFGLCVNPDHLFTGTRSDNIRDMVSKGRAGFQKNPVAYKEMGRRFVQRGHRYNNAILSDEEVRIVRYLMARGAFHVDIARVFGVAATLISSIAQGRTYGGSR